MKKEFKDLKDLASLSIHNTEEAEIVLLSNVIWRKGVDNSGPLLFRKDLFPEEIRVVNIGDLSFILRKLYVRAMNLCEIEVIVL